MLTLSENQTQRYKRLVSRFVVQGVKINNVEDHPEYDTIVELLSNNTRRIDIYKQCRVSQRIVERIALQLKEPKPYD